MLRAPNASQVGCWSNFGDQTVHQVTSSGAIAAPKSQRSALARRWLPTDCVIAVGYVALVAAWSLLIPLNGAPDELSHLFLVEYLLHFGSIPKPLVDPVVPFVGPLTGIELQNTVFWYSGLPFLHSLCAAAIAKFVSPAFLSGAGYFGARLFDWVLGGIFVFALIRVLSRSGLQASAVRLIALLIAAIPQVTFIFAYFNHDAFGVAAVTLALHAFLRVVKQRGSVLADAIYLGASCGLILLSKPYIYPALVFFTLMLALMWGTDFAFPLKAIAARAVATAILVSAPMLVWTYLQFGEVLGVKMKQYGRLSSAQMDVCYVFCHDALAHWDSIWSFVKFNFWSFFGLLGWMNLYLPPRLYSIWFLPLAVSFGVLSVVYVAKRMKAFWWRDDQAALFDAGFVTLTILMLLGTALMCLANSQIYEPQPQGRYLFVVLPFVAYCIALFAKEVQNSVTALYRSSSSDTAAAAGYRLGYNFVVIVLALLTTGMLLVNIFAALFVLAPAYGTRWAVSFNCIFLRLTASANFTSSVASLEALKPGERPARP
jgi:hypothetical protein